MYIHDTLYNTYVNTHRDNLDAPALYTEDEEMFTHRMLLEEIDKAAAGLQTFKTGTSFKVGVLSQNAYQEAIILLAVNKIGAISKFIDFSKNIMEIGESVAESSVDMLAIEACFMPMEPYINPLSLPVVVLGEAESARPNCCSYQALIQKADPASCPPARYRQDACAVIICSSGTTGKPKPIELSDKAINTAVLKFLHTDFPLATSNIMLKIVPSFIGMGVISTLYTCLITGDPIVYMPGMKKMVPQVLLECAIKAINSFRHFLERNELPSNTKLLLFSPPMLFRGLFQRLDEIEDMSFIGCMLAGGSAMSREELQTIDAAFAMKGCTVPVLVGYGQNEMAGGMTMNEIGANKRGSAGKPMSATALKIVDRTTGAVLPPNTDGKVLERSDSLFIGYENMPERTRASFVVDENGDAWFDTNDVGYVDNEGFLFITGRLSRVIIRADVKVLLDSIENKLSMSKYVKGAGVIALKNVPYDTIVGFIVLNDEYTGAGISPMTIIEDIQSGCNPLNGPEMLDKLNIVNTLPYLSSGKLDYRALEKDAMENLG